MNSNRDDERLVDGILRFGFWILLGTAFLKLLSAFGSGPVLDRQDPMLGVSTRSVFVVAGLIEIAVCVISISTRNRLWRGFVFGALGLQFVAYHLTRLLFQLPSPCPCLGTALSWLTIPESISTFLSWLLAAFLMSGGFLVVAFQLMGSRRT